MINMELRGKRHDSENGNGEGNQWSEEGNGDDDWGCLETESLL